MDCDCDFCLIHGIPMRYDFRSGLDVCDKCEEEPVPAPPQEDKSND